MNAQQLMSGSQVLKKRSVIWISQRANSSRTRNILRLLSSDEEVTCHGELDKTVLQYSSSADLVVLDAGNSPEAGLQVLMELKKIFPDVPVLFLSDIDSGVWIAKALQCGARDYIIKSTNVFYIKRIMQNVLESQRQKSLIV